MQSPGVAEALKLISRKGCEKIVRLAFEYARAEGRKTVHCGTKANIMKMTEGLLKRTFEEVAKEYPDIQSHHIIIDNCAHQLVKKPEQFDVIVTTNMNGDIISDLTSALIGGLGFAPSANIGNDVAIFEAVHGSAPKYTGKNVINPIAVIFSAVLMLRHLKMFEGATKIENAVLFTLEEGKYKMRDFVSGDEKPVSTTDFTDAIIKNLGKTPKNFKARNYQAVKLPQVSKDVDFVKAKNRRDMGVDVYVEANLSPDELGKKLAAISEKTALKFKMISNRGTKVYPSMGTVTDNVDHWRCRFMVKDDKTHMTDEALLPLLAAISQSFRWMHIEKLIEIDGKIGFSMSQGED
jgi:isocitrate dehydrogenase